MWWSQTVWLKSEPEQTKHPEMVPAVILQVSHLRWANYFVLLLSYVLLLCFEYISPKCSHCQLISPLTRFVTTTLSMYIHSAVDAFATSVPQVWKHVQQYVHQWNLQRALLTPSGQHGMSNQCL